MKNNENSIIYFLKYTWNKIKNKIVNDKFRNLITCGELSGKWVLITPVSGLALGSSRWTVSPGNCSLEALK